MKVRKARVFYREINMQSFNYTLREKLIGEIPDLKKCFQCGTCASSCVATKYSKHFNPRQIIQAGVYGFQAKIMNDDLWRCTTCNRCNERCPQDVNPYEVIVKLKNIALRNGLVSEQKSNELLRSFNQVIETGLSLSMTEFSQKQRVNLGLREVKPVSTENIIKKR
ncbi:MAG: 4Fe-4S dicluster domain-containing protein [Candidatus Woesearchaeota archaeon]